MHHTFGKLTIDPTTNPAILDTISWDPEAVKKQVADQHIVEEVHTTAWNQNKRYSIGTLADGQQVIMADSSADNLFAGSSIATMKSLDGSSKKLYELSYDNLHTYVHKLLPRKAPRALGSIPRLGIGVRHSTCLWPGIWKAMNRGDFSANAIQNSVRELNLLDSLKAGIPPRTNYLFSFGSVQEGHAGSTFEGLWTYGVASALSSEFFPRYGADADHLQVKRGAEGIERTKQFILAGRHYTFYTLDVSDILNYAATSTFSASASVEYLDNKIPNAALRTDVVFHHRQKRVIGKQVYELDEASIGRFVGKYWDALEAVSELERFITDLKQGEAFDLELSIDENPPEFRTFDTITTNEELLFLIEEIERRGLGITHIAPNFGVEKCTDYRCPDGLDMLSRRVTIQARMASEHGIMLDCHSGDDLSSATRRVFGAATKGRLHYKISPSLQVLYAQTLADVHPEVFAWWWKETYDYTEREARNGSPFAIKALQMHARCETKEPSADHFFFKEYNFAAVGARDASGMLINRHRFYTVSDEFSNLLTERLENHLCSWAEDLFDH